MRIITIFVIFILSITTSFGQDFSNKGKDFWVGYGYHEQMNNGPSTGGSQSMVLYFATDQVTNITISIPSTGYTQNITTAAGNSVVTSAIIPKTGANDARLLVEGLSSKGIHITSDMPMVAYAHVYNASVSGATILYPTNTLGRQYYSINFKNWSNQTNSNCWFYVVAADTGITTVKITPTASTTGGWVAGTTYTITLTQGQIYNVMASLILNTGCGSAFQLPCTSWDLTGSKVESINTGSGCKKIGVFSGSGRISITCTNFASSSDNYMVQAVPKTAWGKKYLTVPANGNQAYNIYRICVLNPATIVKINGVVTALPLLNNFYYELPSTNQPQLIESDSALMVVQYFTSQNACNNGNPGDPEVIYLSSVEQNINRVLWNATPFNAITSHSFNVVVPNTGTGLSSFRLDGAAVTGFVTHPQAPNYSYLKKTITAGFHIIQSDSGFNAIAYGFGSAESYGYNAGTNIKDLYQQIGVQTQYGIETSPSVCTNSPFKFKAALPYIPDSMYWDFHGAAGMQPNNTNVLINNTGNSTQDSSTIVNGRTLHWYSLPTYYNFNNLGVFPITIRCYVPNADCGSIQDIDFDLIVSAPPTPDFNWVPGGCVAEPYQFNETTPQFPKPTYKFWWNFGDPGSGPNNDTSNIRNPIHTFSAPGTYIVRYASITTPGCLSDTISNTVIVAPLPSATMTGNATVCINTVPLPSVTFTGTNGTPPYTFTYNINGGLPLTINSLGVTTTASVQAPTNVAGVFIYNLTNVQNVGSTLCTQNVTGQTVTVNITPDATVNLTSGVGTDNQTLCINIPIINITYAVGGTGTGGSVTGLPAGVSGTYAGGIITITGTPTVSGVFNYTVITTGPCVIPTATGTVTVIADATLTLTSAAGSNNQVLCINIPIVTITYTVGGTGTGGSVTGLPAGVSGTYAGGIITITGTPTVSGVFNYTVITTGPCVIPTSTGTITINPDASIILTSATTTTAQELCRNSTINNIIYTISGGGTGAIIAGLPAGVTGAYVAGVFTISGSPTVAGLFNYTVTTTGTCVQNSLLGTILVNQLPTAAFTSTAPRCETRVISFTDASVPNIGTLTNWTWDFGDGAPTSNTQNPTHVYAAAGTYTVTLTVTNSKGCISNPIASIPVTINNRPVAGYIIPEVCLSDTYAQFLDTSRIATGAIISWQWYFDDPNATVANPNVSTLQNPTHSYTAVGIYDSVQLIVTSALGCRDTIVQSLTVNGSFPIANFTVNNPATLCANDSVAIVEASTVFPGVITKIEIYWDNTNFPGVFQIDNNPFSGKIYRHLYPNFQAPLTKIFTIRYRAYSGGGDCVNDKLTNITVNAAPLVQFNAMPNSCLLIPPFQITQVSEIGGVPGIGVYSGPGVSSTGLFTPGIAGIGTHTILYTFTSTSGGCVDTMSNRITVLDTAHAFFTFISPTCEQVPTSFTDFSTAPASVTLSNTVWNFGDGLPIENHAPASTFTHLFPAPATYLVTMYNVSSYGCNSTIYSQSVTVNPNHSISLNTGSNNIQTVCINTPITPIRYTLAGGAIGATVTGLPAGLTASVTGNILTISGTPITTLLSPYNYSIVTTGNTCVVANAVGVITVTADATLALTSAVGTDNQTLCINIPIINITYSVGGSGTGGSVTGLPAGVTGSYAGGIITITGTPSVSGVFNYTVITTGPCIIPTTIGTISVTADATLTLTSVVGSNNQVLCINVPITNITYAVGGTGTGGSVSGLPTGVTGTYAGGIITITGIPTVIGLFNYTVTTTGPCVIPTAIGTISVKPDHTIAFSLGDTTQSVCVNTAIDPIIYTIGGGAAGVTIANLPPGITYSVTGTSLTISGTPTSTAGGPIFNYIIATTGNSCIIATANGSIQVNPYPVPNFSVDKPTYCIPNAVVTFINGSTMPDGSAMTYLWNFGEPSSGINNSSTALTPPHWYSSLGPFNVNLIVTSLAVLNGNVIGCVHDTTIVINTIHPQPKADFVFNKPSVCIGDRVTITDNTDGKDGIVNQWHWDMGDGTIRLTNPVNYTYNDTITYQIVLYAVNSFGCNSDTTTKSFTVYPYPHVNAGPDRLVLEGGSTQLESVTFANDPNYSWTPNLYLTDSHIPKPRVISPKTDMTYRLTIIARGGCALSDDVFVKLLKFPVIPNTFTPNNDGINDTWRIDYLNTYPNNRIQIFTRAGQLVFESRGYNTPWDGTIKGKPLPFDTYYYIIEPGNGRDPLTGYVTILK